MSDERPDGRTLRYQHRRGQILEAVLEHLLAEGLGDLSFRKLGAAAGISHVTMRHHFGTKDELLLEVFDLIRAQEPVPEEVPGEQSVDDTLRGLWAWWTEPSNLRYLRLMYEAYGLALQKPDAYGGFLRSTVTHWIDDARFLIATSGAPAEEVDARATLLVAQIRGLLLDLLTTGDRARVDSGFELLVELARARQRTSRRAPQG